MKRVDLKVLVASLLIVFCAAFVGSMFTTGEVDSEWYLENKTSITPPNWVFGPVWTILYIMIAFSIYFAWTSSKKKEKIMVGSVFGANLILNSSWSYFFFGMKNPLVALICLILIWLTIIYLIFLTWKINNKSAWLLVPYLLWVSFAGILNASFL